MLHSINLAQSLFFFFFQEFDQIFIDIPNEPNTFQNKNKS